MWIVWSFAIKQKSVAALPEGLTKTPDIKQLAQWGCVHRSVQLLSQEHHQSMRDSVCPIWLPTSRCTFCTIFSIRGYVHCKSLYISLFYVFLNLCLSFCQGQHPLLGSQDRAQPAQRRTDALSKTSLACQNLYSYDQAGSGLKQGVNLLRSLTSCRVLEASKAFAYVDPFWKMKRQSWPVRASLLPRRKGRWSHQKCLQGRTCVTNTIYSYTLLQQECNRTKNTMSGANLQGLLQEQRLRGV